MDDFVSIGSEEIINLPIKESGESFVDLRDYGFLIDESKSQIASRSSNFTKVRLSVAERLKLAEKNLPIGIRFYIKEAYRPLYQQLKSYENVKKHYSRKYNSFSEEKIISETNKLCAPIESAPHPAGAAVDLTLYDTTENKELDLGTEYNADPLETDNATFINASNISDIAKRNRFLLKQVMESGNFICYPSEWWHWSFGDKYWSYKNNLSCSQYGPITEEKIEIDDCNRIGTIYYGFSVDRIIDIDSDGVKTDPLVSVSVSGYQGRLPVDSHKDIQFLSEVYTDKYNASKVVNGHLNWKPGYKQSLTYIDGFGACDLDHFNRFGEQISKTQKKCTAVIHHRNNHLIQQNQSVVEKAKFEEEYLSLALHPYVKVIEPDDIEGWIVEEEEDLLSFKEMMKTGRIKQRKIWLVNDF